LAGALASAVTHKKIRVQTLLVRGVPLGCTRFALTPTHHDTMRKFFQRVLPACTVDHIIIWDNAFSACTTVRRRHRWRACCFASHEYLTRALQLEHELGTLAPCSHATLRSHESRVTPRRRSSSHGLAPHKVPIAGVYRTMCVACGAGKTASSLLLSASHVLCVMTCPCWSFAKPRSLPDVDGWSLDVWELYMCGSCCISHTRGYLGGYDRPSDEAKKGRLEPEETIKTGEGLASDTDRMHHHCQGRTNE